MDCGFYAYMGNLRMQTVIRNARRATRKDARIVQSIVEITMFRVESDLPLGSYFLNLVNKTMNAHKNPQSAI